MNNILCVFTELHTRCELKDIIVQKLDNYSREYKCIISFPINIRMHKMYTLKS